MLRHAEPAQVQVAVRATAPVRVADVGGWTDTWFAEKGAVCSVAVGPGAWAEVALVDRYPVDFPYILRVPDMPGVGRHPMLERPIREHLRTVPLPPKTRLEIVVGCGVPPGSSLGTSAATTVALIGALDAVAPAIGVLVGERIPARPMEAARQAWEAETIGAERQSGVQDQWAAAMGGFGWIEVRDFPHVTWKPVKVSESTIAEVSRRLVTVSLGVPHDSSAVHERVLDLLVDEGPHGPRLEHLRQLAVQARVALQLGDVDAWADILSSSTEAQAQLDESLVATARPVIEVGMAAGAAGAKVNGAGGEGGSVTFVAGAEEGDVERLRAALAQVPGLIPLELKPSAGLTVRRIM